MSEDNGLEKGRYAVKGIRSGELDALYIGKINRNNLVNRHVLVYFTRMYSHTEETSDGEKIIRQEEAVELCRFSDYSLEDGMLVVGKKYITYPNNPREEEFLEKKLNDEGIFRELKK